MAGGNIDDSSDSDSDNGKPPARRAAASSSVRSKKLTASAEAVGGAAKESAEGDDTADFAVLATKDASDSRAVARKPASAAIKAPAAEDYDDLCSQVVVGKSKKKKV
jgi:hypothetical protein